MNHITKQRTILAIEDEKPLLDAIRIRLENMGFRALTARSIEEAIGKLQSGERVDAIWLDHYLIGQENGLDAKENKVSSHHEEVLQPKVFTDNDLGGGCEAPNE